MITKQPILTNGMLRVVKILHGKSTGQRGTVERYYTDTNGEERAQVAIRNPPPAVFGNQERAHQSGFTYANVRLVHLEDAEETP